MFTVVAPDEVQAPLTTVTPMLMAPLLPALKVIDGVPSPPVMVPPPIDHA
jgi:hypothetical protein